MSVSPAHQLPRQARSSIGAGGCAASRMRLLFAAAAVTATSAVSGQDRVAPDTYTAVTSNMMPAGVELRLNVLQWSDDAARAAVIEAMEALAAPEQERPQRQQGPGRGQGQGPGQDQEQEPTPSLTELPTVGVVWRSGSAVGTAIKYAYRSTAADGTEQVVLVTDRPVGGSSFEPWTVAGFEAEPLDYSVIELRRPAGGPGSGTMSLAADVVIDAAAALVTLRRDPAAPELLAEVRLEPKPYWAGDDG